MLWPDRRSTVDADAVFPVGKTGAWGQEGGARCAGARCGPARYRFLPGESATSHMALNNKGHPRHQPVSTGRRGGLPEEEQARLVPLARYYRAGRGAFWDTFTD